MSFLAVLQGFQFSQWFWLSLHISLLDIFTIINHTQSAASFLRMMRLTIVNCQARQKHNGREEKRLPCLMHLSRNINMETRNMTLVLIKRSRKRIHKTAKQVTGAVSPVSDDRFLADLQTGFRLLV